MCKSGIMSFVETLPYDQVNIMKTLEEESVRAFGREKWHEIVAGIAVPSDGMEEEELSQVMRSFLQSYDAKVPPEVAREVFCRVKHGLRHSDFVWAREKFLQYEDIDEFCAAMRQETIEDFTQAAKRRGNFHGQPVDDSVLQFVAEQPHLLYGARDGGAIRAIAIPCETMRYVAETDLNKKRYFACHCQFGRRSILQPAGPVSKTLCHCSLGHTKIFWEAALDTPLHGQIESSVLAGGLLCSFLIHLPAAIMRSYVAHSETDKNPK